LKRLRFITAIPLSAELGSGCFVGIRTLAQGIRRLGGHVSLVTPRVHVPLYTAERMLFNETLERHFQGDATIGFDLDGYRIAGRGNTPHIACIKGVLGDAVRFEAGFTRASMALQAELEKLHARRADRVITISRYCAERLGDLYGIRGAIVVPELIDLEGWRDLFARNPAPPPNGRFSVLCVCRFYPRKRVEVLLHAAAVLKPRIPELQIRIVGDGPEAPRLRRLWHDLRLETVVTWVGNATPGELAREYNRADVFCLTSVQEGFGIVFLEAMAAGKPIVAIRASAVPEVVEHGLLVEPENPEALAHGLVTLYDDSDLRRQLGAKSALAVAKFEMKRVAQQFLDHIP
jgi:glycosyltransferase involved in cell wall biosynthesis